ncbi:hypothetical protein M3Y94_00895200 [Aphelenchoides besseyi]|nr:hypothetical protein M3Y94_00895200 [Aphelenchoides besseyi]
MSPIKAQMSNCYLGARYSNEIDGLLRPSSFGVYYQLPTEPDDVEIELPLVIGYKSYNGKVYHLRVRVSKTRRIYVEDGSENPPEFKDFDELIHYYERCMYVQPKGKEFFEMFPVWLLDEIEQVQ